MSSSLQVRVKTDVSVEKFVYAETKLTPINYPSGKAITKNEEQPLSVTEKRFLVELMKLKEIPKELSFSIAYVCPTRDAPENTHYVYYGAVRSGSRVILPAFFHKGVREQNKNGMNFMEDLKNLLEVFVSPPSWVHRSGIVSHKVTLDGGGSLDWQVDDMITVRRLYLAEFCPALPIGEIPDPSREIKHAIILGGLDSNNTGQFRESVASIEQLQALNRIVRAPKKSIVLLSGPPGAGKEVFAEAIHFGSLRKNSKNFVQFAVGGFSDEEIRRRLFGARGPGGEVSSGLIDEAAQGTLFLDEFDKVTSESFYASLLRVLESGDYYPEGSINKKETDDVNWILAGAFESDKTRGRMPPDFFSRLSDHLELQSPQSDKAYVVSLFLRWAYHEVVSWSGRSPEKIFEGSPDRISRIARTLLCGANVNGTDQLETEPSTDGTVTAKAEGEDSPNQDQPPKMDDAPPLAPSKQLFDIALEFSNVVDRARRWTGREVSMRAIRQASFAAVRYLLEQTIDSHEEMGKDHERLKKEVTDLADQVLKVVCRRN